MSFSFNSTGLGACIKPTCICHSTSSVDTPPTYYQGGSSLTVKMDKQLDNDFTPPPTDTMEERFNVRFDKPVDSGTIRFINSPLRANTHFDWTAVKDFIRSEIALAVKNREEEIRKYLETTDQRDGVRTWDAKGVELIPIKDVLSLLTQK